MTPITIPNALTLLRIMAIPFFAIAVWYNHLWEALAIFVAAGITDLLDGWIARTFNQRSSLGAFLDPAADKLLMTTAFILMALPKDHLKFPIPAWVAILSICRDVVISFLAVLSFVPEVIWGKYGPHLLALVGGWPRVVGRSTTHALSLPSRSNPI